MKLRDEFVRRIMFRNDQGFIKLNDMFEYGIKTTTAHIHLPVKLKKMIKEKGPHYTAECVNEELYDALQKLCKELENHKNIDKVFAVSPLLSEELFRERLEMLGFETEPTGKIFESLFPDEKNLQQCIIPLERLKKVLEIEKETREDMDKHGEMWHDRILYYKYEKLKEIGIIDHYKIPLEKVVKMGKANYDYRHGRTFESKSYREKALDQRLKAEEGFERER